MGVEEFKGTEDNIQRYKENVADLTQEFELGLFLYLLNKIKWYAILILIISISLSFLYLRYTPKTYETGALIQVAVKEQPNGFSDLYTYNINTNLNSEIALMNSQKAIDRVIEDLNLKVFYYFEGEILTRFLYDQSPFTFENFSVKDESILSEPIYLSGKLTFKNGNWEDLLFSLSSNERLFFKIPNKKEVINTIKNSLTITIQDQSAHSIKISHQHTNPHFSKDICNSIVKIYMNYEINKKQKSTDKIVAFIETQKDSVKNRLIKSEKDLRIFKKNNKFKNKLIDLNGFKDKAEEIEKEIVKIQLDIDLMDQFSNMFENNLSTEINSSSVKNISLLTTIFYGESVTSKMIAQLEEDVNKRDDLLKDITPNNKNIILLNGQIEESILYIKKAVKLLKKAIKKKL